MKKKYVETTDTICTLTFYQYTHPINRLDNLVVPGSDSIV